MTPEEAVADPRLPELVKRYELALTGDKIHGPRLAAWYAQRELQEGQPCIFRTWRDESGAFWSQNGANEPTKITCSGSSAIEGRGGAVPSSEAESTGCRKPEVARGNGRASSSTHRDVKPANVLPEQGSLFA